MREICAKPKGDTDTATIAFAELDCFGIIILFVLLYNTLKLRTNRFMYDQKLYEHILIANIIVLFLDMCMWVVDGKDFFLAREVNYLVSALYYFCNPLICYLWLIYADYKLFSDAEGLERRQIWYSIPLVLNAIMTILSVPYGYLFYVDSDNVYHRGDYFLIMVAMSYIYFVYTLFITLRKRLSKGNTRNERNLYTSLTLFALPPFIASVIQTLVYGVSLIWEGTVVSLLVLFINIQSERMNTDYLTGFYNRRQLMSYLDWKLRKPSGERLVFAVLADVDNFKSINDVYGHSAGDGALSDVADALRAVCDGKTDFLARYGGDEFVIISERDSIKDIDIFIEALKRSVLVKTADRNQFPLSVSVGYAVLGEDECQSADRLIATADKRMYFNKKTSPKNKK